MTKHPQPLFFSFALLFSAYNIQASISEVKILNSCKATLLLNIIGTNKNSIDHAIFCQQNQ